MIGLDSCLQHLKSHIFLARGRKPYARGYLSYRQIQLERYLNTSFPEGSLPPAWGQWLDERVVEYPWFFSRLPSATGNVLDAGSVLNHDYVLSHEKLQNKTITIFTLAPEDESYWDRGISYLYGDLRDCCCRDDYFDWVVSISTLEHVGMNNTRFYTSDKSKNECRPESYLEALTELRRVLKSRGVLFLSLPFGRAENHQWLQIFDKSGVEKILDAFQPASSRELYFRYASSGWQLSSEHDCRDARYFDSSKSNGATPEFAAAEAVVCLELVK
jgi:hypothetical protein